MKTVRVMYVISIKITSDADTKQARAAYQKDGEGVWAEGELVVSADMMRIFLLPQLPHKECIFTSCLVYEIFSAVGKRF